MAVDSMNKVIHAAVRRDLRRLEAALAEFEDGDRGRAGDLLRAWGQLATQLTHHHETEDDLLWPVLLGLGVDSGLLSEMEAEHQAMATALAGIDARMSALAGSGRAVDADAAGEALRSGRVVVDHHLDHEETVLEPEMLKHVDSPEWKRAQKALRRQPLTRTGWLFAWLQDDASDEVNAYLGSTVPAPVRWVFSHGFGRGYHRAVAPVWR